MTETIEQPIKPTETPLGRPTLYKPEYCEKLIAHGKAGQSFETFALECDPFVNIDTLYEWAKPSVNPDFSEAKKKFDVAYQKFWENTGFNGMMGIPVKFKTKDGKDIQSDPRKFNGVIWSMFMKNKLNWKDKQDITSNDKEIKAPMILLDTKPDESK